jgi:hypothetical protein
MDTRSLDGSNARLREEFDGLLPPEKIDEVFRQSTDELASGARVDNFVPLLAERRTRTRLAELAHA